MIALVLAGTGSFVYLRVGSSLSHSLNQALRARADDVGALAGGSSAGDPREFVGGEGPAQLIGPSGRVLKATPQLGDAPLLTPSQLAQARRRATTFDRVRILALGDGRWRILATPAGSATAPAVAVVAASLEPREQALDHLLAQLLLGGAGALLLAALAGYVLATAALRPVEAMSRKAAEISLRGDMERLPVPESRDEIAKLGERLNEMLERIEAAFVHERRFLADASHELRTPLSILQGELELALRQPRSREELERVLRSAQEETDRLSQLAHDLLVAARADEGELPVRIAATPAREILRSVADDFEPRARRAGRSIRVDAPPGLRVPCDPVRVGQALGNLVDNSLRYGAGEIAMAAVERDGVVELHVSDDGAGFPARFLPRAFERFSRADEGRSGEGSGLGLAIVDAIARAHGGSAGARNRGIGADVWLAIPKDVV